MTAFSVTKERIHVMPGTPILFVNGVKPCSICGEKKTPGYFRDSPEALGRAIEYLKERGQ